MYHNLLINNLIHQALLFKMDHSIKTPTPLIASKRPFAQILMTLLLWATKSIEKASTT